MSIEQTHTQDDLAVKVQGMFKEFLQRNVKNGIDELKELDLVGKTLKINFKKLELFDHQYSMLLRDSYLRFEPYLRKAVFEVLNEDAVVNATGTQTPDIDEYWVRLYNLPEVLKIRDLRTSQIGKLITISGTVTRTSEVRPELLFGRFTCLDCGSQTSHIEQQYKFTEPTRCPNYACQNRIRWQLDLDGSRFVDWQRCRVQENAQEIPSGSMPRCIDVIMRHDAVEVAKAGDKCLFTGSLIVVPDVGKMIGGSGTMATMSSNDDTSKGEGEEGSGERGARDAGVGKGDNNWAPTEGATGLKMLGVRDLNYRLCFLCTSVEPADGRVGLSDIQSENESQESIDFLEDCSQEEKEKILLMQKDPKLYGKLIDSLAPNIYGHDEVKRGILLMLFGGVHKETEEGINLRGDVNVMIVGDPSTAKSQFLKYVSSLLPRAVYTSGKASSAAGLTASVVRDPERGEFTIEAGALMLADNGVCCIDEFDKMDGKDQVAIHEAMEQQTISIAKAGIRASLNARASILAAANPIGGRYNPRKTLRANLGITPAIMSRFDLFFVIQDECNEDMDRNIAEHIVSIHQKKRHDIRRDLYTPEEINLYLKYARTIKPELTKEAQALLVESYRKLRQNDKVGSNSYRITVRQLESLVRLSEGLARLYSESHVETYHVEEAVRLLRTSITKVDKDPVNLDGGSFTASTRGRLENDEQIVNEKRKRAKNQEQSTKILIENLQRKRDTLQLAISKANRAMQDAEAQLLNVEREIEQVHSMMESAQQDDDDDDMSLLEKTEKIFDLQKSKEEYDRIVSQYQIQVQDLTRELNKEDKKLREIIEEYGEEAGILQEREGERPKKKRKVDETKGRRKTVLSYNEYKDISFKLLRYIRSMEGDESDSGVTRQALIDWYINDQQITRQEATYHVKLVDKIIERLIERDNFLMECDDPSGEKPQDKMDRILIVSPVVNLDEYEKF